MLDAIILICALSGADCTRDSAVTVLATPIESGNPATCFMQAQAYLAGSALGRDLRPGDRVRIACVLRRPR